MDVSPEEYMKMVAAVKSGKPAPDGPILAVFQPEQLAAAIEHECERTAHLPNQKITLHMDPIDAMLLAKYLRFRSL
jgi:hypothetical protein